MNAGLLLLSAVIVVSTSCTSDAESIAPTSVAESAPSSTAAPVDTDNRAERCVSTDPGATPISVHRALSCPDGTKVWVRGILRASADGTELCDPAPDEFCVTLETGGLPVNGTAVALSGTVSGGVLSVGGGPTLESVPAVAGP